MTVKSNSNFEFEFFTWLKTFLNDKGLQFSRCGLKTIDGLGARHEFDLTCSVPDDHIHPRRSAFFMARSVLRDIRDGVRAC